MSAIRLSKLMAQRGLCSRREADRFIADGLVMVDGEVVDGPFTETAVDGVPISERIETFAGDNEMPSCAPPRGSVL